ncbi:MAG: F0F1 ATP synthase subunit delta [Candidatus Schekmanbacteria bacterium]|nr:F0F1 ATP synthase subunit delta [Candidatus Schekmanbacteria bacterium]
MKTRSHKKLKAVTRGVFFAVRDLPEGARVSDELAALVRVLEETPSTLAFLRSPLVDAGKKIAFAADVTQELAFHEWTAGVVTLLGEEDLLGELPRFAGRLCRLLDDHLRRAVARVRVRHPLDDRERQELEAFLGASSGLAVRVEVEVDPSIIGGFVAQVGDVMFDASVATQLKSIKDHLIAAGA